MRFSGEDLSWGTFPFVFGLAIKQAIRDYHNPPKLNGSAYEKGEIDIDVYLRARNYIFGLQKNEFLGIDHDDKEYGLAEELKNLAKLGVLKDMNIDLIRRWACDVNNTGYNYQEREYNEAVGNERTSKKRSNSKT